LIRSNCGACRKSGLGRAKTAPGAVEEGALEEAALGMDIGGLALAGAAAAAPAVSAQAATPMKSERIGCMSGSLGPGRSGGACHI
jgi:hypothetical protein